MKKPLVIYCIISVTFLLLGASCSTAPLSTAEPVSEEASAPSAIERVPPAEESANTQTGLSDEVSAPSQDTSVSSAPGEYRAYEASVVTNQSEGDTVVLFFHASWCPTCAALEKDIQTHLSDIPSNVTILKTDYPKERELIKKYGVTYQHTLVHVNSKGERIAQWSGGNTLTALLSHVQ